MQIWWPESNPWNPHRQLRVVESMCNPRMPVLKSEAEAGESAGSRGQLTYSVTHIGSPHLPMSESGGGIEQVVDDPHAIPR